MKKIIFILIIAPQLFSQTINTVKKDNLETKVPIGSICYDINSQMLLDRALENGVKCESTLREARKWRDKYKRELEAAGSTITDQEPADDYAYQTKDRKTGQIIVGGAVAMFLLGFLVGSQ